MLLRKQKIYRISFSILIIIPLILLASNCKKKSDQINQEEDKYIDECNPKNDRDIEFPLKEINKLIEKSKTEEKISIPNSIIQPLSILSNSNSPEAIEPLLQLAVSKFAYLRELGVLSLGRLCCNKKNKYISKLLESEEWQIRKNGAWMIGRSQKCDTKTIKKLIDLLNDEEWEVRMFAAWALGRHKIKSSIPELKRLANTQEGMRDGAEAAYAIEVIEKGPYRVNILYQPLWLAVPDQDFPLEYTEEYGGVLTIKTEERFQLFGYEYEDINLENPLKLSFEPGQNVFCKRVHYWGGEGVIIKDNERVVLSGPYHKFIEDSEDKSY